MLPSRFSLGKFGRKSQVRVPGVKTLNDIEFGSQSKLRDGAEVTMMVIF